VLIDIAGRPVVSAQRRESADVAVLPKKRATRTVCAEFAIVFAVRICDRCCGLTDRFPAVVDPTSVHPTVLSSKRAEVDLEFADVYRRAARYRVRPDKEAIGSRSPFIVNVQP